MLIIDSSELIKGIRSHESKNRIGITGRFTAALRGTCMLRLSAPLGLCVTLFLLRRPAFGWGVRTFGIFFWTRSPSHGARAARTTLCFLAIGRHST
jgi:hypothetical protein